MVLKGVPAFLLKLHRLLDDAPPSVIRWDASGESFLVLNADVLAATVLPDYFKHANFNSFLRQLNMYHFTKQPQQLRPGSRRQQQQWRFSHADFRRGRLDLLPRIHRKTFGPGSCRTIEGLTAALDHVQAACSEAREGLDELQTAATMLRSQQQFLQEHQAATSNHLTELHGNVDLLVQMLSRLCGFDPAQHTETAPLTAMPPTPSLLAPSCTITTAPSSPAASEMSSVGSPCGATDSGLDDCTGDEDELLGVKTEPGLVLDDGLFGLGLEGDSMACMLDWPAAVH